MKYLKLFEQFELITEQKLTLSSPIYIMTSVFNSHSMTNYKPKTTYTEQEIEQWFNDENNLNLVKMSKVSTDDDLEQIIIKAVKWLDDKVADLLSNSPDYRKLVFSEKSFKNLSNYKPANDIRVDVLRTLPNRKDIIQWSNTDLIKYKKTNDLIAVFMFSLNGSAVNFIIDLVTGLYYLASETRITKQTLIEDYYSKFMQVVTYLELTDVTLNIVDAGAKGGNILKGNDIKNELPFKVIQVNSNWNTGTISVGDAFGVVGHWRLAQVGTGAEKRYKYIFINPYQKTGIINRKAGKDIHESFSNQESIDKILDKINKYGIDSLTWHEKELLKNSDNAVGSNEVGSDEIQKIANDLVKAGYLDVDNINIEQYNIEIYGIKDKDFPYFVDNHLRIGFREEDDEIHLDIYPEDYGEPIDLEERYEVFDWIENNWNINGYVIWLSDDGLNDV